MQRHPTVPRVCEQCGKPFNARACNVERGFGKCCSRKCGNLHRRRPWQERFWPLVNKNGPMPADPSLGNCWTWHRADNEGGYGRFAVASSKSEYAHRWSYLQHVGEIAPGLLVCHKCDNPLCVRPSHLFLGTINDNNQDMKQKDRYSRGENHSSHKLTEPEVVGILQALHRGESKTSIAERNGVTRQLIGRIGRGEIWKHLGCFNPSRQPTHLAAEPQVTLGVD